MSLKTWCEEFYPVPACNVPESEELDHSIRKWEGLRPAARKRHGVSNNCYGDLYSGTNMFSIDVTTCALCVRHYNLAAGLCPGCPLSDVRGADCVSLAKGEREPPYDAWYDRGDPRSMLKWLRRAKRMQEKKA
jgi:hypothetical protein